MVRDAVAILSPDGGVCWLEIPVGSADDDALLVESAAPVDARWRWASSSLDLEL